MHYCTFMSVNNNVMAAAATSDIPSSLHNTNNNPIRHEQVIDLIKYRRKRDSRLDKTSNAIKRGWRWHLVHLSLTLHNFGHYGRNAFFAITQQSDLMILFIILLFAYVMSLPSNLSNSWELWKVGKWSKPVLCKVCSDQRDYSDSTRYIIYNVFLTQSNSNSYYTSL